MRTRWMLLLMLMLAGVARAADALWPLDTPLPQDALLVPSLQAIVAKRDDIQEGMVVVDLGRGNENPRWMMSQTQLQIFINKLMDMPEAPLPEDDIWPKLKDRDAKYGGIRVILQTWQGKRFRPITVHRGRVVDDEKVLITPDYGRRLEYWFFGTARVRRDQMVGAQVLPVISFEQCRLLGQKIVETRPRQCLLPDNNLLLESNQMPTLKSAKITDFDGCLKNGESLIYTFPRRCVAAGGRVFTEPAQVYEQERVRMNALRTSSTVNVTETLGGLMALATGSTTLPLPVAVSGTGVPVRAAPAVVSPSAPPPLMPAPVVRPVSGTVGPMSEADLLKIEPAAGPAPVRGGRASVFKYEWADLGR